MKSEHTCPNNIFELDWRIVVARATYQPINLFFTRGVIQWVSFRFLPSWTTLQFFYAHRAKILTIFRRDVLNSEIVKIRKGGHDVEIRAASGERPEKGER